MKCIGSNPIVYFFVHNNDTVIMDAHILREGHFLVALKFFRDFWVS